MALQSMTGFARADGADEGFGWVWEVRSVNGKSLDVRFRLPPGNDQLEQDLKKIAAKHVARGNIQASLTLDIESGAAVPVLNEAAFEAALAISEKIAARTKLQPSIDALLSMRGVVESGEGDDDEETRKRREAAILAGFSNVMEKLAAARVSEGAAIARVIEEQVSRIGQLTAQIEVDPSRSADSIRAKLSEQLSRLVDDMGSLDPQRLHQEAAILATKADLAEEIDRLKAHVAQARELMGETGAIGRRLDFLAQEFNRECNTICSKSNASSVTKAGLEMKVIIDQFREQIQNLQ